MSFGNPGLVVRLRSTRDSRTIHAYDRGLISGVDLFPTRSALLGAFAAFSSAALLREKRRNPRRVDEVTRAYERRSEKEVKEYTIALLA